MDKPKCSLSKADCHNLMELIEQSKKDTQRLLTDETLDWTVIRNEDPHVELVSHKGREMFKSSFVLDCSVEMISDRIHPSGPYRNLWDTTDTEDVKLLDVFGENDEYNTIMVLFKSKAAGLAKARECLDIVKHETTTVGRRMFCWSPTSDVLSIVT